MAVSGGRFDFTLFAIWANNPHDRDGQYITQVWKAILLRNFKKKKKIEGNGGGKNKKKRVKKTKIDYCFASLDIAGHLRSVEVGDYEFWVANTATMFLLPLRSINLCTGSRLM